MPGVRAVNELKLVLLLEAVQLLGDVGDGLPRYIAQKKNLFPLSDVLRRKLHTNTHKHLHSRITCNHLITVADSQGDHVS